MKHPIDKAISILAKIKQLGCEEVIVCPGGRNAPFVEVLSKNSVFKTQTLFEERSAGFYGCGLTKKSNKPVAVITTSGTAVAELLPSVIEAYYQGLPLIVITADRPKSYRGSGAPQSIKQDQILSEFCQASFDLEADLSLLHNYQKMPSGPMHINICFDEPLLINKKSNYDDEFKVGEEPSSEREAQLSIKNLNYKNIKQPLIILGQLDGSEAQFVLTILKKLNTAIYAEAHSGLKYNQEIKHLIIEAGAKAISTIFKSKGFDSVIRIGGIPTLRFWRDLDKLDVPVINFSKNNFSGLSRIKENSNHLAQLNTITEAGFIGKLPTEFKENSIIEKSNALLKKYPNSEQTFVYMLSKLTSSSDQVFLANSLPIREWDSFASPQGSPKVQTLRGANGIDGNISYFLGLSKPDITNVCILGDLTALYDMAAGFLYKKYYQGHKIKIVIINNGGGKIFTPLFNNEAFENNHDIEFSGWAKMFGLGYQRVNNPSQIKFTDQNEVIELIPDNNQSACFTSDLNSFVKELAGE